MTFAESLRSCREMRSISAAALARQLGVSRNTILNWESARTEPTISQANAIALALDCRFDGRLLLTLTTPTAPICSVAAKTPLLDFLASLDRPLRVRVRKAIWRMFSVKLPSGKRDIDPAATLADLCQKTPGDFLAHRQFGITSLNLLRNILLDWGLCLRGDSPLRADA